MGRARALGQDEQAANSERRALELRFKAGLKTIGTVCKSHPHVILDVVKYLASLGYTDETASGCNPKPNLQAQAAAGRNKRHEAREVAEQHPQQVGAGLVVGRKPSLWPRRHEGQGLREGDMLATVHLVYRTRPRGAHPRRTSRVVQIWGGDLVGEHRQGPALPGRLLSDRLVHHRRLPRASRRPRPPGLQSHHEAARQPLSSETSAPPRPQQTCS